MIVGVFREQQRPQVFIPGKFDSEKLVDLSFKPTRAAEDIANRRRDLIVAAQHSNRHPGRWFIAVEMIDQLKSILEIQSGYRFEKKSGGIELHRRIPDAEIGAEMAHLAP